MTTGRINIRKLSQIAGVAPSTVSRILSGKVKDYRISEKTEKKVMEIAERLGYRPNYLARSLNTGMTHTAGLVFANSIDAFLGRIMEGVESYLRNTQYQMAVATCENNSELEKKEISRMLYREVDGIIIYPSAPPLKKNYPLRNINQKARKPTPVVVIGREIDLEGADFVLFSDFEAGRMTALDFLDSGKKCFAVINLPINCSSCINRTEGFLRTLHQHGIKKEDIIVVNKGQQSKAEDIARLSKADCIWAINTGLLLEYLSQLANVADIRRIKLRSVGEIDLPGFVKLDIQTFPMPAFEMGRRAAELLVSNIEDEKAARGKIVLPWPQ